MYKGSISVGPFISIITATRNAAAVLPQLLDSLVAQTYADFEVIVQDALSSDNTRAITIAYTSRLSAIHFASEQDAGIYDAWNKALSRARGEWCLFLGADDRLYAPDVLQAAVDVLMTIPDTIDYFATSLVLTLPSGEPVEEWHPLENPLAALPVCMPLPHPALFYRRRLFNARTFDISLQISGDYAFIAQTLTENNVRTSKQLTACMSVGGVSGSLDTMLRSEMELLRVSRRYFPRAVPWKLFARICRSALCQTLSYIAGEQAGRAFADYVRRVQGKPPLWARLAAPSCACSTLPAQPHVSLVVTVIGRTEPLMTLFSSLQKQSYINFSIVLVDQNPPHVLADVCVSFPELSIKHLHTTPSGVSHARNVGLQHAQGDIIAFPDDDCWYEPDTLAAVVEFFREHPCYAGVLGRWMEMPPKYCTASELKPLTRLSAFTGSETYTQFYRRDVIQAVGDFDVQMGPGTGLAWGCGEDTDYVLRAIKLGFCVGRTATIRVHHPRPLLQGALTPHLLQKHTAYALGRMYLLKKHAFPLWFKVLNVLYPLALLPLDTLRQGRAAARYRWAMFMGRLRGLFL